MRTVGNAGRTPIIDNRMDPVLAFSLAARACIVSGPASAKNGRQVRLSEWHRSVHDPSGADQTIFANRDERQLADSPMTYSFANLGGLPGLRPDGTVTRTETKHHPGRRTKAASWRTHT